MWQCEGCTLYKDRSNRSWSENLPIKKLAIRRERFDFEKSNNFLDFDFYRLIGFQLVNKWSSLHPFWKPTAPKLICKTNRKHYFMFWILFSNQWWWVCKIWQNAIPITGRIKKIVNNRCAIKIRKFNTKTELFNRTINDSFFWIIYVCTNFLAFDCIQWKFLVFVLIPTMELLLKDRISDSVKSV